MADLKATHCGDLPNDSLHPQAEQIISLLERRGIVEDTEITSERARLADKDLRRNMYHNTQQMLKYYTDKSPAESNSVGLSQSYGKVTLPPVY